MPRDFKHTKRSTRENRKVLAFQQQRSEPAPDDVLALQTVIHGHPSRKTALAICFLLMVGMYAYMRVQRDVTPSLRNGLVPYPNSGAAMPGHYGFFDPVKQHLPEPQPIWFQEALKTVNATCQRLKNPARFRAYNNVPYFKYTKKQDCTVLEWMQHPLEAETKLVEIFTEVRQITQSLIKTELKKLMDEFNLLHARMAPELNRLVEAGGFNKGDHEEVLAMVIAPMYEYNHHIALLIDLHVHAAVTTTMQGGLAREFARLSGFEILRTLVNQNVDIMPSITMVNFFQGDREYSHSLISVNEKKPQKQNYDQSYFCDSWLYSLQGESFFSGIKNHPLLKNIDAGFVRDVEIGIVPNLSGYPQPVKSFYARQRQKYILGSFTIPKVELKRLKELAFSAKMITAKSDAGFEANDSLSIVEEMGPRAGGI